MLLVLDRCPERVEYFGARYQGIECTHNQSLVLGNQVEYFVACYRDIERIHNLSPVLGLLVRNKISGRP